MRARRSNGTLVVKEEKARATDRERETERKREILYKKDREGRKKKRKPERIFRV